MDSDHLKRFYSQLNTQFLILAGVSILIFVPVWMYVEKLNREGAEHYLQPETESYIGISTLIIVLILISIWHFIYHRELNKISADEKMWLRLNSYKKAFLTLIIQMTSLSALVSFLYLFVRADAMIAGFAVCLVLISMNRITPQRIARQLRMKKEEKKEFFEALGI